MTTQDALTPLVDVIVSRVMVNIRNELEKLDIVDITHDRSLTREQVMDKLNISAKALTEKVRLGTVPPPYTHCDEFPRWSEKTIEKYMAGDWRPKK